MFKLYPSMALTNIKSSRKTYIPYMISCMLTISLYYIICSLSSNENLTDIYGGNTIQSYMGMGQFIVAIFAVIFLFYINSFLIKRRKKEFGLYNILGMEKRHIAKVIFMETLYTFLASFISGIILGILLDKLMYLVILRIFNESVPLGFYVSVNGIIMSLALFGIIFMLIFLNSVRQVYTSKPVELLKSDNRGEAEPKAKWVLAIIGVICLAAGYFIAVTTENPVSAFALFFVAVVLVIIGTYLVFTAGSIVLLKLLKKKKITTTRRLIFRKHIFHDVQNEEERGRSRQHMHPFNHGAGDDLRNSVHKPGTRRFLQQNSPERSTHISYGQ